MKVAAYQAPLLPAGSMEALALIRERVQWCEEQGIEILCCPEAVLGGLADYADRPFDFALNVSNGQLSEALAPLTNHSVATIVGFTERSDDNRLFNSAAVFDRGEVVGVYRKLHPAIRKSVYAAGTEAPVFTVRGLTFGILICNDSNFPEAAGVMVSKGATVLFVPSNNGLPIGRPSVADAARAVDVALATANRVHVVRADVVGETGDLQCEGSSEIVSPAGGLVHVNDSPGCCLFVADVPSA